MPKQGGRSPSKRLKLKDKFKIIRKVKEHERKKRKEAKKAGKKKPSLLKDPGIPSNYPYREQFAKEMNFEKQRILANEAERKEMLRLKRVAKADEEMAVDTTDEIEHLGASAARHQVDFEARSQAGLTVDVSGDNDNSRRYFYKEFKKVVGMADVIMQVLDARDPMSCRCSDVERYIRSVNPNKKIILVLNKIDLVPKEVAEQWLKFFRQELPTIAFKAATKKSGGAIAHARMPKGLGKGKAKRAAVNAGAEALLGTSECLGADTLIQLLKNYTRNLGIKTAITVGVVGMPNVGKSSLINSLKRAKVAQVGNTPGVTKVVQEIHLDKQIRLLDSPGVVFATAENEAASALRNCVKIEKLADPVSPVGEILARVDAKKLQLIYKIAAFETVPQLLQLVAASRGKLKKGGTADESAAARIILMDWNDGRIPFYTTPPSRGNEQHDSAALVAAYAADFDAEAVFANEESAVIEGLPSIHSSTFFEAQAGAAATLDFEALERQEAADEAATAAAEESDQEDIMDEDPAPAAVPIVANTAQQNAALYSEAGQHNPKKAKAAKKKAKKARTAVSNEAFDFNEDFDMEDAT